MRCANCGETMDGIFRDYDRKFCSIKCKNRSKNMAATKAYQVWRHLGLLIAGVDPERFLITKAPIGAAYYRLTCPKSNGSRQRFPPNGSWRLRPFEAPRVPVAGEYEIVYSDSDLQDLKKGGKISIGPQFSSRKR